MTNLNGINTSWKLELDKNFKIETPREWEEEPPSDRQLIDQAISGFDADIMTVRVADIIPSNKENFEELGGVKYG